MKESSLQAQCVEYLSILAQKYDDLIFFSIPNEGLMFSLMSFGVNQNKIAAIINHFKKLGLLSGIPDFCILFRGYCYFIEFKAEGKKPNEKQVRIHDKINKSGFDVFVCDNFDLFRNIIEDIGI